MRISETADVIVIGAGAAGWPAAVGAARAGARTVLFEEDPFPGGAALDQYVLMPDGGPRSGVIVELLSRLASSFELTSTPPRCWWNHWYLPTDFLRALTGLLKAERRLEQRCGVRVDRLMIDRGSNGRGRVTGVIWKGTDGTERSLVAPITIDATGVGDLLVRAGMEGRYGEDAKSDFGERLAPDVGSDQVQLCTWMYISQRLGQAKPFDFRNLRHSFPLESGMGWPRRDAEGLMRRNVGVYLHWGCRVRCRDTRDPEAMAAAQNDALALMEEDLDALRKAGYAVYLAPRLGVREQWRIMGEAVVTSEDILEGRIPDDSVLITQRGIDVWSEQVKSLGDFPPARPYGIPFRALIPKGFDGILVAGKHLSGTHLAMASYRVQCLLAQIGQAAGIAAALSAQRKMAPCDLPFSLLASAMRLPPQNLVVRADPEWVTPPDPNKAAMMSRET